MGAFFAGTGAGFERSSVAMLGGMGLVGNGSVGRAGQSIAVNAATGNLTISQQDEFLVGMGPDLSIARTYNSLGALDENNDHWRQSTDRRIRPDVGTPGTSGSSFTRVSADGSEIRFIHDSGNLYKTVEGAGAFDSLEWTAAGRLWTWTDGDTGRTEIYEELNANSNDWRLTSVSDTNGNTLTYTYDGDGRLSYVETQDGSRVTYAWDTVNNRIDSITSQYVDIHDADNDGSTTDTWSVTKTIYQYNLDGQLWRVTTDLSPNDPTSSDTFVVTYAYESAFNGGNNNLVTRITENEKDVLGIAYSNTTGQVIGLREYVSPTVTRDTSLSYLSGSTQITDPAGQVTTLTYDSSNRLTQIEIPPADSASAATTQTFTYGANNDVSTIIEAVVGGTETRTTTRLYDANGNVSKITDPTGHKIDFVYIEVAGRQVLQTRTEKALDEAGNLTDAVTRYLYDSNGNVSYQISPEGRVSHFTRNADGTVNWRYDFINSVYEGSGGDQNHMPTISEMSTWFTSAITKEYSRTKYTYDANGNLASARVYNAKNSHLYGGSTQNALTTYQYDEAGRVLSVAKEGEGMVHTAYDGLGRTVSTTSANGGVTTISFNDAALTSTVSLSGGYVQVSTFDHSGALVSRTQPGGQGYAAGGDSYLYDYKGNLRTHIDHEGNTTHYVFNNRGLKVAEIDVRPFTDPTSDYGIVRTYRYDEFDQLIVTSRHINPTQDAIIRQLEDLNADLDLADVLPKQADGVTLRKHVDDVYNWYRHDDAGRVIYHMGGDGSVTTYEYDEAGRLISTYEYANRFSASAVLGFQETYPTVTDLPPVDVSKDRVTRTFYNEEGEVRGVLSATGALTEFRYNGAGQQIFATTYAELTNAADRTTGSFETLKASVDATDNDDASKWSFYNTQGHLRYEVDALGRVVEYRYEGAVDGSAHGQVRQVVQYAGPLSSTQIDGLDTIALGDLTTQVNAIAGSGTRSSWMVYDTAGNLAYSIAADGAVVKHSHDSEGRVVKVTAFDDKRTTTTLPTLAEMDSWAAPKETAGDVRITRSLYNEAGQLVFAVDAEGYVAYMTYNSAGQASHTYRYDAPHSVSDTTTVSQLFTLVNGTANVMTYHTYDWAGRKIYDYDGEGARRYFGHYNTSLNSWDIRVNNSSIDPDRAAVLFAPDAMERIEEVYQYTSNNLVTANRYRAVHNDFDGLGDRIGRYDALNNYTSWDYDAGGRLIRETDAENAVTEYKYDALGRGIEVIDARGNSSYSFYDALGRVVATVGPEGYLTTTEYNGYGEVKTVTRFFEPVSTPVDPNVVPAGTTHTRNQVTEYTYDNLGRLLSVDDGEGGIVSYTYNAHGQRKTMTNAAGAVTTYTYYDRGLVFSESVAVIDPHTASSTEIKTEYVYDARGNVIERREAAGSPDQRITTFTYDKADRLLTETRPAVSTYDPATGTTQTEAHVLTYTYDRRGNVVKVSDTLGLIALNWHDKVDRLTHTLNADGVLTETIYDLNGNVQETRVYETLISPLPANGGGQTPPIGSGAYRATIYTYDGVNRVMSSTQKGVDAAGATTESITTTYTYDAMGHVRTETVADGTADARTTTYEYDNRGQVEKMIDALGHQTQYEYNSGGQVWKTTDALGQVRYNFYDTLGRNTLSVDAEGYVTATSYTTLGNIASVTRFDTQLDGPGIENLVNALRVGAAYSMTPGTDATTSFTYDNIGRTVGTEDALNHKEIFTLNAFGDIVAEVNKAVDKANVTADETTTYTYDDMGRLISSKAPVKTALGEDIITTYAYDVRGNLTRKIEATGLNEERAEVYVYDDLGRHIRTEYQQLVSTNELGERGHFAERTTTMRYNLFGELIESIDTAPHKVTTEPDRVLARSMTWYDDLGRVTDTLVGQYNDGQAQKAIHTQFERDTVGNVTKTQVSDTVSTMPLDATGHPPTMTTGKRATEYTYDALNRQTTSTIRNVTTAAYNASGSFIIATGDLVTTNIYDAVGQLRQVIDANGAKTTFYYDARGLKVSQIDAQNYRTDWVLDENGNALNETRYALVQTAPAYDVNGVPLSAPPANPATSTDDRRTTFEYDLMGQRTKLIREDVKVFDANTNTHTIADSIVEYGYNALGQVDWKKEATGDTITYTYDVGGRLESEERSGFQVYVSHTGSTPTLQSHSPRVEYSYNGHGDIATITEKGLGVAADRVTRFEYDENNQAEGGRLRHSIDAEGNYHKIRFDSMDRKVRDVVNRTNPDGTSNDGSGDTLIIETLDIEFDLLGNLVGQQAYEWNGVDLVGSAIYHDRTELTYNAFNQLVTRSLNGIVIEENVYDAAGRLIETTSGDGVRKFFLYDAVGNQTAVITSSGADTSAMTLADVLGAANNNIDSLQTGLVATTMKYDARGMVTEITERDRELTSGGPLTDIQTTNAYNAFGEMKSQTDAGGHITTYEFNTMGRVIKVISPQVSVIDPTTGSSSLVTPEAHSYYDVSGRMVASKDANGNLTRQTLLAGSGYGDDEALVTEVTYADGGSVKTSFSEFGDARFIVDQIGRETVQTFDKVGRLTMIERPDGLNEHFRYDSLGQKIRRWATHDDTVLQGNTAGMGPSHVEKTFYDVQGRITQSIAIGGDTTQYSYAKDTSVQTSGLGTFGGWVKTTTYANGLTSVETTDAFQRIVSTTDLGQNVSTRAYDFAGRLASVTGGLSVHYTYFNTGRLEEQRVNGTSTTERVQTYGYDARGNLVAETYREGLTTYRDMVTSHDGMGRMTYWENLSSGQLGQAKGEFAYDANGNILRFTRSTAGSTGYDRWYEYDSVNRVTLHEASWDTTSHQIDIATGTILEYDAAGQQITMRRIETEYFDPTEGDDVWYNDDNPNQHILGQNGYIIDYHIVEKFKYDDGGRLEEVKWGSDVFTSINVVPVAHTKIADFNYDGLGRMTEQIDYRRTVGGVSYQNISVYNDKGQINTAEVRQYNTDSATTLHQKSTYSYGSGTSYRLGAATSVSLRDEAENEHISTTNYEHIWANGAVLKRETVTANGTTNASDHYHTWIGGRLELDEVKFTDNVGSGSGGGGGGGGGGGSSGVDPNLQPYAFPTYGVESSSAGEKTYVYDLNAQGVKRTDDTGDLINPTTGVWHVLGGQQLATSADTRSRSVSYSRSIDYREDPASSENGILRFETGVVPITSYSSGSAGGAYTVQDGDTLAGIAARLWGDSSLWYKIARANGLASDATLIEGQVLTLPTGVIRNTNNASTFKVHNPAEVLGNTSPDIPQPAPPKEKGCGFVGKILLTIVAVAVATVVSAGVAGLLGGKGFLGGISALAAPGATVSSIAGGAVKGFVAGAIGGAAGSIASQGVGIAIGAQDGFSWNQVGMAALGGGLGANSTRATSSWRAAVSAAGRSVVSQGIGVALGMQSKFSWSGVAAAGVSAGVIHELGDTSWMQKMDSGFGQRLVMGGAGAAANAATRSVLEGTDFGDNLIAALPDVIGQTIGGMVAGRIVGKAVDVKINQRVDAQIAANPELLTINWSDSNLDAPTYEQSVRQTLYELEQARLFTGDDTYAPENNPHGSAAYYTSVATLAQMRAERTMVGNMDGEIQTAIAGAAVRVRLDAAIAAIGVTAGPDAAAQTEWLTRNLRNASYSMGDMSYLLADRAPAELITSAYPVGDYPSRERQLSFNGAAVRALEGVGDVLVAAAETGEYVSNHIESNPFLRYTALALEIASGPVTYVVLNHTPVGDALAWGAAQAATWGTNQLHRAGVDPQRAGQMVAGGLLLGGLALGIRQGLRLFDEALTVSRRVASGLMDRMRPNRGLSTQEIRAQWPRNLQQQAALTEMAQQARNDLLRTDQAGRERLRDMFSARELAAIEAAPWRLQLGFGHAVERRVADQVRLIRRDDPDGIFGDMEWTGRTNAPQDFIDDDWNFDITGSSQSSIFSHYARPRVDSVVTYDSIPQTAGGDFVAWLKKNPR